MAHHHDLSIEGIYVAAGSIGSELQLIPITRSNKFARKVYEADGVINTFVVLKDGRVLLGGAFKNLILLKPHRDEMYLVCGIFDTGSQNVDQIILNTTQDKAFVRLSKPNKIIAVTIGKYDPKASNQVIE